MNHPHPHEIHAAEWEGMPVIPEPEWIPVASSNLAKVRYDPVAHELQVRFQSGAVWAYAGVMPGHMAAFWRAESKGKFFSQHIKGHFDAHEIKETA